MSATRRAVDLDEAARFLAALDPEAKAFTFQTFTDAKGADKPRPDPLSAVRTGTLAKLGPWLARQNQRGAGIYVTVNSTNGMGRKAGDIVRVRAVWQEDDGDGKQLPLEPHVTVQSSPGHHHRYLLVDGLGLDEHGGVQQRLVADYGSDKNAADLSRVLRVPGFYHRCGERVQLVEAESFQPYTREAILEALPPVVEHTPSKRGNGHADDATVFVDVDQINELRSALASLRADDRDDWVKVGQCLRKLGDVGRGLWISWSQSSDKWQPHDAHQWDTFAGDRAGWRGVLTMAQERGWVNPRSGDSKPQSLILTRGDAIAPKPITWIWRDWLAAGKVHLLGGAPGTGKTTLALAILATITQGGRWPDGMRAEAGDVGIWSGEDDPEDVLVPRLLAMGADMTRVYFVSGIREDGHRRAFDPAHDSDQLLAALPLTTRALLIDPIVSAVAGDSHKNAEVRRALQPLVDAAHVIGFALIGITHFTKGTTGRDPVERLTGSLAFGAAARIAMVTARQPAEGARPERRILLRAKSNIGPDGDGFAYAIEQVPVPGHPDIQASRTLWGETIEGTARDILAEAEAIADVDGQDATGFLGDLLRHGSRPAREIYAEAEGAGFSRDQMKRAKKKLGVEAVKRGMESGWVWQLPKGAEESKGAEGCEQFLPLPSHPSKRGAPLEGVEGSEGSRVRGTAPFAANYDPTSKQSMPPPTASTNQNVTAQVATNPPNHLQTGVSSDD